MITPLLPILGLPLSHLYAIPILFSENGEYAGYDNTALTTKMDGKGMVANKWGIVSTQQVDCAHSTQMEVES